MTAIYFTNNQKRQLFNKKVFNLINKYLILLILF